MGVCQYIFIFQSRQYLSFFLVGSEWHGSALASMQGLCLIVQGKATMYMMKLLGIITPTVRDITMTHLQDCSGCILRTVFLKCSLML
ncbi:uncharacterized protein LOC141648040 isoform X13 [Silene latifolia]|uniref:uncharacterized protein LOC141648040 isoform X13 n=1 Tax=Silene latifolia TaxID=37657 RepID=UPI003D77C490